MMKRRGKIRIDTIWKWCHQTIKETQYRTNMLILNQHHSRLSLKLFCNYFFFHSVFVFHYIIIEEKITYTEKWVAAFFSVTKTAKSLSLSFAHNYEPYYTYMHVCNPPLTEFSYSSGPISGNIQFSRFSPAADCCWMTVAPRIYSAVDACY